MYLAGASRNFPAHGRAKAALFQELGIYLQNIIKRQTPESSTIRLSAKVLDITSQASSQALSHNTAASTRQIYQTHFPRDILTELRPQLFRPKNVSLATTTNLLPPRTEIPSPAAPLSGRFPLVTLSPFDRPSKGLTPCM